MEEAERKAKEARDKKMEKNSDKKKK